MPVRYDQLFCSWKESRLLSGAPLNAASSAIATKSRLILRALRLVHDGIDDSAKKTLDASFVIINHSL